MKNLTYHFRRLLAAGALACVFSLPVADAQQATQPAVTADVQVTAPPNLPYGAGDVLKLSQAKISDEIIVNYIHNAATVYNLQPNDIVYLRNQGVSDQVLTTMVNQRSQVAVAAQAVAAQNAAAAAQNEVQPAPTYAPPPAYDQYASAEEPAPAPSTVYVIPNSAAYTSYAPSYGYSYPYYYGGYYGSFGLGYCGSTYYNGGYHGYYHSGYGGWHGGYHGGGYHGGGGHGSSGWHGGGSHVASAGFHGVASHGGGGIHVSSGGFHGGGGSRGGMHR
jgi:hypothetical protein